MSKKKIISIIGLTSLLIIFLSYHLFSKQATVSNVLISNQTAVVSNSDLQPSLVPNEYSVSRVVDGDTIVVNINGQEEKVRLIGVDTPETVDPRKPIQCFGREASDFVKNMLTGKSVRLESDPSQSDRDKYGRFLRYVYLGDVLVNEEIISSGYGYEYTYHVPYKFQKEFKASQAFAQAGKIGLWSPNTCNGKLMAKRVNSPPN